METLSSTDPVRGREAPPDPDTDIDSLEELREVRWVKEQESKPTDGTRLEFPMRPNASYRPQPNL